ncbi:hypothetical protein PGB90_007610 [Kerria lacca]
MKKRSSSGNIAIGIFILAALLVILAFFSHSWLVSDYRITGANFNRLGLWHHCFRSLPDPNDEYGRRFFVGCRWIFDPFTTGYDQIRGYLVPTFMVLTQFFYTLTFLAVLACGIGVLIFFLCCTPHEDRFIPLTFALGLILVGAGISAALATLIFGFWANRDNWMLGHDNNFFGWSFGVAVASVFALLASGILFLTEAHIQKKKQKYLKESQSRLEMAQETKA